MKTECSTLFCLRLCIVALCIIDDEHDRFLSSQKANHLHEQRRLICQKNKNKNNNNDNDKIEERLQDIFLLPKNAWQKNKFSLC